MNTHWKCSASAYKHIVVYKRAAIYKGLVFYLLIIDIIYYYDTVVNDVLPHKMPIRTVV